MNKTTFLFEKRKIRKRMNEEKKKRKDNWLGFLGASSYS
jgi:hypothetical protein